MITAQIIFWISFGVVFYTYIGYVLLLVLINRTRQNKPLMPLSAYPPVTVIIPAYNELTVIDNKVKNTLQCDYPADCIFIIVITDGSDDGSESLVFQDKRVLHIHQPERLGKASAINHAMQYVNTPYTFITDANTFIHPASIQKMMMHYQSQQVGGVSGEKRIQTSNHDSSVGGEGLYWKYESFLKREGALFYSVVGAAGELFSFKSDLFKPLPNDTILDDFVLSIEIVKQGFVIAYEPEAFANEAPSQHIDDEFNRKVRISSGVWQALIRLPFLFNPILNPRLFFQFVSHRLLRWTLAPIAMLLLLVSNVFLFSLPFYFAILMLQLTFYAFALIGFFLKNKKNYASFLFVPFYYCMMNFAVAVGFIMFIRKKHSALWKKANR